MKSVFRKLRQTFLYSNKVSKYLLYAIGEIILVVIGILIALQINNWNEKRQSHQLEHQLLENFRTSLQTDLSLEIIPNIQQLKTDTLNLNVLINTFNNKLPYNDSLKYIFGSVMYSKSFKYEVTAYKTFENLGVGIITNKALNDSILHLYNMDYPELQYNIGNFTNNLTEFNRPLLRRLFKLKQESSNSIYFIPVDTQELYENVEFLNVLTIAKLNFTNIINQTNHNKNRVERLIEMINEELKNSS